jgi:hypothetical protein
MPLNFGISAMTPAIAAVIRLASLSRGGWRPGHELAVHQGHYELDAGGRQRDRRRTKSSGCEDRLLNLVQRRFRLPRQHF